MENIISHYYQSGRTDDILQDYRLWRYNKSKFHQWLRYRHSDQQGLDAWDQFILKNLRPGTTVIYDSQAVFWRRLGVQALVIENSAPAVVLPYVDILNDQLDQRLQHSVNNLVMYRPLSIKLTESLADYLDRPQLTRSGNTPNLLHWLANDATIFLSIGQEFFAFNRFKQTMIDFVKQQAAQCEKLFDLRLTVLANSQNDQVNGNIKIVLQRGKQHGKTV